MSSWSFVNLTLLCGLIVLMCGAAVTQDETSSVTSTISSTVATTTTTAVPAETSSTAASSSADSKPVYLTADDVPTCQQKDGNLNECLRHLLNIMLRRYKNGNKELEIPPYEPFLLNTTSFQYKSGGINGRISIKNTRVYGFSNSQHKSIDLKLENGKANLNAVVHIPKVNILGQYKADIAINNVHMRPKGNFNVTILGLDIDEVTDGEVFEKNAHRFLRLKNLDAKLKIGDLKFNATGIFPDPTLNELVLNLANQYWRRFYGVLLPETRRYWQPMVLDIINVALTHVPIDNFVTDF